MSIEAYLTQLAKDADGQQPEYESVNGHVYPKISKLCTGKVIRYIQEEHKNKQAKSIKLIPLNNILNMSTLIQ